MFVKTDEENNVLIYPYTIEMFRSEHRNKSLPKFLNNDFLSRFNVYPVQDDTKPDHDSITQYLYRKQSLTLTVDGWKIGWEIRQKPEERIQTEQVQHVQKLKEQINQERDRRIVKGFVWNGYTFQSDKESYDNIMGAGASATASILMGADPNDIYWADTEMSFTWLSNENVFVEMAPKDVIEFGQVAMNHKSKHFFAGRTLKNMEVIPEDFADDKWWPKSVRDING